MLSQEQQNQLNKLISHRDEINNSILHIEEILKVYFPEEFSIAYQHWIPQVLTALFNDLKWLPRGEATLQDTVDRIKDSSDDFGGVSKFIK